MELNREKLARLVHYVIWRAGQRPDFGAARLSKALWFADARHYLLHGKPITGETYVRERHGPTAQHLDEILTTLEDAGTVVSWSEPYSKATTITRYTTDTAPDTSCFSQEELGVVDWWVRRVAEDHPSTASNELSHNHTWEIAAVGEVIPLYAILAARISSPVGEEMEWAKAEAARLGLH